MALNKKDLKLLMEIYMGAESINIEKAINQSKNFFKEGYYHVFRKFNKFERDEHNYRDFINGLKKLKEINYQALSPLEIREKITRSFDNDNHLVSVGYRFLNFIHMYRPEVINKIMETNINQWIEFAKSEKIDLTNEIETLELLKEDHKEFRSENDISKGLTFGIEVLLSSYSNYERKYQDSKSKKNDNEYFRNEYKDKINDLFLKLLDDKKFYNKIIDYSYEDFLVKLDFTNYPESVDNINKVNNVFKSIYEKTSSTSEQTFTLADEYLSLGKNDTHTSNFLKSKFLNERVYKNINVANNNPISNLIIFRDSSALLKYKDEREVIVFHNEDIYESIESILKDDIAHLLRKKPVILKQVIESLQSNFVNVEGLLIVIDTFLNNENILKSSGFDLLHELKKTYNYESIDDKMNLVVRNHKIKQYAHSIASNKYDHLYNKKSYAIFSEIYDLGVESSIVQNLIGKRLAAYKTSKDFNEGLKSLLNTLTGFDKEMVIIKAEASKIKIINNQDNKLVLEIVDFNQSKLMGSPAWCISRDKHYFDSYIDVSNHQYFIYDFDKESTDVTCMIGITLNKNCKITSSSLKDNQPVQDFELIQPIIDNIKKKQPEYYLQPTKNTIKNISP